MATTAIGPEEKAAARKAAKAQSERKRRARIKAEQEAVALKGQPDAEAIAKHAAEVAPEVKTPIRTSAARSLLLMLGEEDPMAYCQLAPEALKGREPRAVVLDWARGKLADDDPANSVLRARMREIGRDPRGKNVWGKKAAALLVAVADLR